MKRLICLFILTSGIISCSSDDEINIDNMSLNGKWNWISSCGGITPSCWYPDEDNFESVEFKYGFMYIKRINGLIDTVTYYSITETITTGSNKLFKIEFQNGHSTYFSFIDGNLSIEGGDFLKEYERVYDKFP